MGRHSGPLDPREHTSEHGTDAGPEFDNLTPQQKAAEFDASHNNPTAYAARNFGATPTDPGSRPLG